MKPIRRVAVVLIRSAGWLPMLLFLAAGSAAPADRPNVVFIVADDLGYGEPGCYGGKEIPTPHLDALAAQGVRFTSGYVTAPFCAASRAALMTGRYQTRFGFEFNPIGAKNADPQIGLPADQKTVADYLRDAGYATALVGKWHLGGTAEYHPQRRGFDEFFGFLHEGHYYVPQPWIGTTTWLRRTALPDGSQGRWFSPDGKVIWSTHMGHREPPYDADNPLLRSSQPIDEPTNLTDAFTREACRFIERQKSQPFFLHLAYNAVHSPLQADDVWLAKFKHIPDIQRRIFAAMLAHLDDGIGQVLAKLKETGVHENTLVVFLSDNGGPTKELTSSNAPLRGGKGDLWEGGVRIPFVISWPGKFRGGQTLDVPVISPDAVVTALTLAGARFDASKLDGRDLRPLLAGETAAPPHETLYWRVGRKHALRHGDWKLIREGRAWLLYNLAADLAETTDLADAHPDRVQDLSTLWDGWNAAQMEPRWR
jgi:arylsulfatase A-like enzyme